MSTVTAPPRIHKLPPDLVGKIAAGEVVERPASVVKELLENALDAGATAIDIRLEQGGLKSIEVADDGGGMAPGELPLAVTEHATSKVRQYDDLFALTTLGFRGEALGAIRRVSRLSLASATLAGHAHELTHEGDLRPAVRDVGTTVRVHDLFYNTPARKKFMKEASRELMAATEVVLGYALMHHGVGFSLMDGGRVVLRTLPQPTLGDRVAELYGREAFKGLVPVQTGEGEVALSGFLSRPSITRSDNRKLFFLVNGRLVQDRWLQGSLLSRYRGMIPPRKYPYGVVAITLPPHLVDVNVHPTKREVRFVQNGPVFVALSRAVDQATRVVGAFSDALPPAAPGPSFAPPADGEGSLFAAPAAAPGQLREPSAPYAPAMPRPAAFPQRGGLLAAGPPPSHGVGQVAVQVPAGAGQWQGHLQFLAQLYNTYLLFTLDGAPYLADQHVAHERVLFDQYARALGERGAVPSQGLLVPMPLNLTPPEVLLVARHREALLRFGLDVEPFGEGSVLVRGLPPSRRSTPHGLQNLLEDALTTLEQHHEISDRDQAMLARLSCRGAVMAGDPLDGATATELLKNLLACRNPDTCPHGRPIISALGEAELAPRFHRPNKPRCGRKEQGEGG